MTKIKKRTVVIKSPSDLGWRLFLDGLSENSKDILQWGERLMAQNLRQEPENERL